MKSSSKWLTPHMATALEYLWSKRYKFNHSDYQFDHYNYGGLPEEVREKLSSNEIDLIQDAILGYVLGEITTKSEFINAITWKICNKALGELGN